jgi:hypothetical protein
VASDHSRTLLLAEHATETPQSALERRLEASMVAVSVDPSLPLGPLAARVLLTTLRRGPGTLVLEPGNLRPTEIEDLEEMVNAVDGERPLRVGAATDADRTVRIHVGCSAPRGVIRIVPEAYGGHLAAMSSVVIQPARPANALGAISTAGFGATEVFKHTAGVRSARRVIHRHLRSCPVTLSEDLGRAPELPDSITLDLGLLGVGAIGTGIALILSELPAEGTLLAVDRQRFGPENRGTYAIGTAADVASRPYKVELAARVLRRFDVHQFPHPIDQLLTALDAGTAPWTRLVLTALDTPEARREAQRLWPDRLIDGATGDAMVGLHDYRFEIDPCMICLFSERHDVPSGAERAAAELGIPPEVLADGERLLETADLQKLSDDQRRRLEPQLGKPICGLLRALGSTTLDADGYMPSAPFISLQAACLSVGRLLADRIGVELNGNVVQYDSFIGPQHASVLSMQRTPACYCSARAHTIATVRARRAECSVLGAERGGAAERG